MAEDTSGLVARPTGSVFIGNTSFSGADIQLVVHIYDGGKRHQEQEKEISAQMDKLVGQASEISGQIVLLQEKILEAKQGTPEWYNLSRLQTQKQAEFRRIGSTLNALTDTLDSVAEKKPPISTKVLAEVQTISISSHRVKSAVRACGKVYPVSFVRGQREIAGSMVFTVFHESVFWELMEAHATDFDATAFTSALLDQLPPMDVTISFANEYGQISRMAIYGVEFVNEGQTMSIEDILTENVVQYVARDFDPMRSVRKNKLDTSSDEMSAMHLVKASDLLLEDDYQTEKDMMNPFTRFRRRNNPFL